MTTAPGALDALAGALGPGYSTPVVHRAGRRPRLTVVDRHTRAATEVCADDQGRYVWPPAAADQITRVLRALAQPAHG